MNYGISKSSGKVVGILHSDDVYFNFNILSNVIKNFKNKDIDLIYGDILYSKKNDLTVYKRSWSNIQIKINMTYHHILAHLSEKYIR